MGGGPDDGDGVGAGVDDLERRITRGLNGRGAGPEATVAGLPKPA